MRAGAFFGVLLIFGLGLVVLLFSAFIQENLVEPIAVLVWVFWRLLQSIDQIYFWSLPVILALIYVFARLLGSAREPVAPEKTLSPVANATLERISFWRTSIRSGSRRARSETLERELGWMLAAIYATGQPEAARFQIYDQMKRREIALPGPVYTFLFPPDSASSPHSLREVLARLIDLPRRGLDRCTGRERVEYDQALDRVLEFIDSILKDKNNDGYLDSLRD